MKRFPRIIALLLAAGILLAACGAQPSPAATPSAGTPGADPILTWHREGGIAGFCDDLAIYASGDFQATSCKGTPARHVGQGHLSAEQEQQLNAWLDRLQPFAVAQGEVAAADAMTVNLTFSGKGAVVPTEADKQAVLNWAGELYAQMAVQP
jgi:hypothetical protein